MRQHAAVERPVQSLLPHADAWRLRKRGAEGVGSIIPMRRAKMMFTHSRIAGAGIGIAMFFASHSYAADAVE